MTAAYKGLPRRRPAPQPPTPAVPESLSASERSHRKRLVREARAAVQIVDDPVQRLMTRRELAEELDEPAHHDSVAPEAREAIERLVGKRRRAAQADAVARREVEKTAEPAEIVMPTPVPLPEPASAGATQEPLSLPVDPVGVPSADEIAALARARRTEVAAANETATAAAAEHAVSDIARLLARRNGA